MSDEKVMTLVFVRKPTEILLGLKKRGFGAGKWNGFGGKVEPGETILQSVFRELKEESELRAKNFKHIGILDYEFRNDSLHKQMKVYVFETYDYDGEIHETEEMYPKWYDIKSIPFHEMWKDNRIWFPYMLEGRLFQAHFLFLDQNTMVQWEIKTSSELPSIIQ